MSFEMALLAKHNIRVKFDDVLKVTYEDNNVHKVKTFANSSKTKKFKQDLSTKKHVKNDNDKDLSLSSFVNIGFCELELYNVKADNFEGQEENWKQQIFKVVSEVIPLGKEATEEEYSNKKIIKNKFDSEPKEHYSMEVFCMKDVSNDVVLNEKYKRSEYMKYLLQLSIKKLKSVKVLRKEMIRYVLIVNLIQLIEEQITKENLEYGDEAEKYFVSLSK